MAKIPSMTLIFLSAAAGFGLGAIAGAKFATLGFLGLLRDGTLKVREPQP